MPFVKISFRGAFPASLRTVQARFARHHPRFVSFGFRIPDPVKLQITGSVEILHADLPKEKPEDLGVLFNNLTHRPAFTMAQLGVI